jgi:phosphopantetheine adenylyltransferase
MKSLNEVLQKKSAVFAIGKFNPPTKAHMAILDKLMHESAIMNATPVVFLTHDMDRDNPLSGKDREKYLKLAMPKLEACKMCNMEYFSPTEIVNKLHEMGYTNATIVTKESDVEAMVADFNRKLTENFDTFSVMSIAEDETTKNSEKLMENVLDENFSEFYSGIIEGLSDVYAKEMYTSIKEGLLALDKIDESIKNIPNSLNVPRAQMPQIKHSDVPDFVNFMKNNGVKVEELDIDVSNLQPTQKEIDPNKVKIKYDSLKDGQAEGMKPFIISNDNHILDGHHQLYALKNINSEMKVHAYKVDCPITAMLDYAKMFPKTEYKSLDEDQAGTDASFYRKKRLSQKKSEIRKTRERQKSERDALKDKQFSELQKARELEYEKDKRARQGGARL